MATKKRIEIWAALSVFVFLLYFFAAARPIPHETVLSPLWLSSLDGSSPLVIGTIPAAGSAGEAIPFTLGDRFGFVGADGNFFLNRQRTAEISLGEVLWTEHEALPSVIEIMDLRGEAVLVIEEPWGYPLLLDGRIFILGSEQNALWELDMHGNVLWTYAFSAPLTSIDAAAGLVATGSIDGVVEVLDSAGNRIFIFEPGGSRHAVILGLALSSDGARLAVVSGIENQRFLLLERFGGGEFQVIHHEFLGAGFRRPVHVTFFYDDWTIAFEREGGVGIYETGARQGVFVPLEGQIIAFDERGGQGLFFLVASLYETEGGGQAKELVGIKMPGAVAIRAPFASENVFLGRRGSMLLAGGGQTLIAFEVRRQ